MSIPLKSAVSQLFGDQGRALGHLYASKVARTCTHCSGAGDGGQPLPVHHRHALYEAVYQRLTCFAALELHSAAICSALEGH